MHMKKLLICLCVLLLSVMAQAEEKRTDVPIGDSPSMGPADAPVTIIEFIDFQGRYWEMHDLMMARSPKLDRASLIAYAGELGLDVPKFIKAIDGGDHAAEIDRDLQLAQSIDLYSTPTFYINGRQVVGERPFDFFKKIIDEELQLAGR